MLIFTKIHEQHFLGIKKLNEMNNQFKNTDIEIAESVDLNEPLEKMRFRVNFRPLTQKHVKSDGCLRAHQK